MARCSAAVPVGPTGLTTEECGALYLVCSTVCKGKLDNCDSGFLVQNLDVCLDDFHNCNADCRGKYHSCLPKSAARKLDALDSLIPRQQVTILEAIAGLSAKIDVLNSRVAADLPVDLAPQRITGSTTLVLECQGPTTAGTLQVHVVNQGTAASPPSTTHVDFASGGGADMPTPGLPAGGSAAVQFAVPPSCWVANKCSFTFVVDFANVVVETNEANNSAAGICDLS